MTTKQAKAIQALCRSPTFKDAAEEAGVGVSTLRRWMREDGEFIDAFRAISRELLAEAAAQSKRGMSLALTTMTDVMKNGESSQARIAAARATLEYALRLHEAVDIEERLTRIEQQLKEADN